MKPNDVIVRPATEDDLEVMGELWWEMAKFHSAALPIPMKSKAETSVQRRKYVQERLGDENSLTLVAETEGHIVGYCRANVGYYPPVYEPQLYGSINELIVAERYRRRGIGEAMVGAARDWFKSWGVSRVEVGTMTGNPVSNAFWEKMGFVTFREVKQIRCED